MFSVLLKLAYNSCTTVLTSISVREVLDSGALRQVVTGNWGPREGPGLGGCVLVRGDSNPESMLLSDDELFSDLVRERSMDALYVHGLWVMGTVSVCVCVPVIRHTPKH